MQNSVGSVIENVYHVINAGAAASADADFLTAVELWLSDMYDWMSTAISDQVTPVDIVCDVVEFQGGKVVTVTQVGTIPWTTWGGGTGAADPLPSGTAMVVNLVTGLSGVQGRKYLPYFTESHQSGGIFAGGTLTLAASYLTDLLAGFLEGANGYLPRLMSTKYGASIGLTAGIIKAIVGYQRRRKTGVGA
jgi:hypothetical protein